MSSVTATRCLEGAIDGSGTGKAIFRPAIRCAAPPEIFDEQATAYIERRRFR
jgi:hypothetical protein